MAVYIPRYQTLDVSFHDVSNKSSNATVNYIEAGDAALPNLLLLHGYPSSSYEFRDLIPMFSDSYHVLAPDYPGFGLTQVGQDFRFTFDNITRVIAAWLIALGISQTAVYVHDYGAPVGFRLAISHSIQYSAIITQNGNLYKEGFGQEFWAPIFRVWNTSDSQAARDALARDVLNLDAVKAQYTTGTAAQDLNLINPEAWTFNYLQNLQGPNAATYQIDLFYDYRTNVELYPQFQEYLRTSQVPVLAVWGKNDPAFVPAGARAIRRDSPQASIFLLDAGHFAIETKRWEIARISRNFLSRVGW